MISEILSYLLDAWNIVVDYTMLAFYAQIVPDWHFILQVFLIAAFLLGSAFLSATIAESRRHKMKLHFLLGLLIPYIYPLVMAFTIKTAQEVIDIEEEFDPLSGLSNAMSEKLKDIQKEQQDKHDKRLKRVTSENQEEEIDEAAEVEQAEQVVPEEETLEVEEIVEEVPVFCQRYFQNLAVDSSGAKAGPFKMVVLNGSPFKVCQIKNIQADMASFEVEVSGKTKNIRIKYDNILTFDKIQ